MEVRLDQICFKPSDFKICKECEKINWYENRKCSCGSKKFTTSKQAILRAYEKELIFWIKEEGYNKEEADGILQEV